MKILTEENCEIQRVSLTYTIHNHYEDNIKKNVHILNTLNKYLYIPEIIKNIVHTAEK